MPHFEQAKQAAEEMRNNDIDVFVTFDRNNGANIEQVIIPSDIDEDSKIEYAEEQLNFPSCIMTVEDARNAARHILQETTGEGDNLIETLTAICDYLADEESHYETMVQDEGEDAASEHIWLYRERLRAYLESLAA